MGRSSTAKKAAPGQFVGVGRTKGARRANSPAGSKANRKYYVYVTKDQRGTPMEKFINARSSMLEDQFNAMNSHPNGLRMATNEATSKLHGIWSRVANRMTKGAYIGKFIEKNGGTVRGAKTKLKDISGVCHFGSDPIRP